MKQRVSEVNSKPSQTSKIGLFGKIIKGWNLLNIFAKSSILGVQLRSKYSSEFNCKRSLFWRETYIPNTHEKSTKNQGYWTVKCRAMFKNVERLCCHKVKVVEYLDLFRYEIWWYECGQSESLKLPVK